MRIPRPYILLIILAATPAATAHGATQALFQLYNFSHFVQAAYDFDSFYQKNSNGVTSESTRHNPEEHYRFNMNYAVYSPRLLRGDISLDLEGQQQIGNGTSGSSNESNFRFNYDINGTLFRLKPYPVSFYFDSNFLRINPVFSRSYDQQTDQYGATLTMKNSHLPATLSYSHYVSETSGLVQDRRDTLNTIGLSISNLSKLGSTTVGFQHNEAFSEALTSSDGRQDNSSVVVSATNTLHLSRDVLLSRYLISSYSVNDEGGNNPGKIALWRENFDWDFGRSLKMRFDGSWDTTVTAGQRWERRHEEVAFEHRLFQSLTTRINAIASQSKLDSGTEDALGGGANVSYQKKLPNDGSLLVGYGYQYLVTDSKLGADSIFYRDDTRLNVDAAETNNPLKRDDIIISTIVVWDALRTKTYTAGVDYTAVQDGRKTRLRVESGSSINIGDVVRVDYSVNTNKQLKFDTSSHALSASLSQGKYRFGASLNYSVQGKIAGSDTVVPVSSSTSWSANLERSGLYTKTGILYTNLNSGSVKYQTFEGYWKYNRDYDRQSLSVTLDDILSIYREASLGGVVSGGGTTNGFLASAIYRRWLTERLSMSVTGQYQNSSGRDTNQHIFTTWLQTRWRAALLEAELNTRLDWRFYRDLEQRDFSVRIDLKRHF